ncbi:MAG TPA: RDD family protein [Usitatibacter sp.]
MSGAPPRRAPAFSRRLASGVYELLLLTALTFVAIMPFLAVLGDSTLGWKRHALQLWIVLVCGTYFVSFWTRGGQTLPMKTWHLRIVRADGASVGVARAIHRYVIAVLGFAAAGLGFLWALVDRDGQFLHDRLSGTAIVDARGDAAEDGQRLSAR